jgi:hypothetical protein
MEDMFETHKVQTLVDKVQIDRILVVDTNTLMNYPDFSQWEITSKEKILFVLSQLNIIELEHHKEKANKSKSDDAKAKGEKARKVSRSISNLGQEGSITDGIKIDGVGWFISILAPKAEPADKIMNDWKTIAERIYPIDIKFMISTMYLFETIKNASTYLFTGDVNLHNMSMFQSIPTILFDKFPFNIKQTESLKTKAVTGEKYLTELLNNLAQVELTLGSKKRMPRAWLGTNVAQFNECILVAEGTGVINGTGFCWSLPYVNSDGLESSFWVDKAFLDFGLNEDNVLESTKEKIAERIAECAHPFAADSGVPTLQNAASLLTYFNKLQYKLNEWDNFDEEMANIENQEKFSALTYYRLAIGEGIEGSDTSWDILTEFFKLLTNTWDIGETIQATIWTD